MLLYAKISALNYLLLYLFSLCSVTIGDIVVKKKLVDMMSSNQNHCQKYSPSPYPPNVNKKDC